MRVHGRDADVEAGQELGGPVDAAVGCDVQLGAVQETRRSIAPARPFHLPEDAAGFLFDRRSVESFRPAFTRAAKAAGLPRSFTPHSLRHLWASTMLAHGVPVPDVSGYLGHQSIQVTYSIYRHAIPSSMDRAVAVLDDAWEES